MLRSHDTTVVAAAAAAGAAVVTAAAAAAAAATTAAVIAAARTRDLHRQSMTHSNRQYGLTAAGYGLLSALVAHTPDAAVCTSSSSRGSWHKL
jgi:hypothetical protein